YKMYLISTTLPAAGGSCKIPASGIPAPAGRPRKPPPPRRVAPAPGLSAGTSRAAWGPRTRYAAGPPGNPGTGAWRGHSPSRRSSGTAGCPVPRPAGAAP
ncbi:HTH-type transcriptional regulator immR, partial [Dysosmobacter welbionis]